MKIINENSDGATEMDEVGRLIQHAGARESVPNESIERARHHVRRHWEQVVAEQRVDKAPRRWKFAAIAAGFIVLFAATMIFRSLSDVLPVEPLANVDRVVGEVRIADEAAARDGAIEPGAQIVTASDGRIALRMSGGQSLRIDTDSRVILLSPDHISLETGAVYIDSNSAAVEASILVSTPLGTAQDIGTQFQVRVVGMLLVVGVRQGLVEISQPGQKSESVNHGYYLQLAAGEESKQHPIPPDSDDWEWIETVVPEFDIQGASLEQYLRWYARERGLKLVWASTASQSKARSTMLSGSMAGANLEESLAIVKQVAPFEHRVSDKRIWVKVE